jgi:hypothetical protein
MRWWARLGIIPALLPVMAVLVAAPAFAAKVAEWQLSAELLQHQGQERVLEEAVAGRRLPGLQGALSLDEPALSSSAGPTSPTSTAS